MVSQWKTNTTGYSLYMESKIKQMKKTSYTYREQIDGFWNWGVQEVGVMGEGGQR